MITVMKLKIVLPLLWVLCYSTWPSEFRESFDEIFGEYFRLWCPERVVICTHWWEPASSLFQNFFSQETMTAFELVDAPNFTIVMLIVSLCFGWTCIIRCSIDCLSFVGHLDQILHTLASIIKVFIKLFIFALDEALTFRSFFISTLFHQFF